MIIHRDMSLDYLSERMSNTETVSDDQARMMRDELCENFLGIDTSDVPQDEWDSILNECTE